ncbi:acyl-CoA thioesterase [Paeniclostridium sordellii]|uniref:acyl-CoA thioesterase n=1 Tax=Paraclostridium sordellii TaxID=1505 RepID=UPI00214A651F|nr:hotdog domain-containing protein [Paeniclostridium sordellii]MCR1850208.1 acyl-CoA thioesterase [Paeniclostridium sordellii]
MEYYDTHRLVKSEDLNHHGTLFAGRMTEWFVESCFITVANEYKHPENLVCLKVHEVKFSKPIRKGDIINIKSKIVYAGKTILTVYGKVLRDSNTIVEGFLTFVCVDNDGVKMPHNLVLQEPRTEEDIKLLERVNNLRK